MPTIRQAAPEDAAAIRAVHCAAFKGDEEAGLVERLCADPTAAPALGLVAVDDGRVVGHILFTAARLAGVSCALLAPLGVDPAQQRLGIGGALIRAGLADLGSRPVFVFGDPKYYSRFGFAPAEPLGLRAPHTLPAEHADAWMVRTADGSPLPEVAGTVQCAAEISHERYWVV